MWPAAMNITGDHIVDKEMEATNVTADHRVSGVNLADAFRGRNPAKAAAAIMATSISAMGTPKY